MPYTDYYDGWFHDYVTNDYFRWDNIPYEYGDFSTHGCPVSNEKEIIRKGYPCNYCKKYFDFPSEP